MQQRLSFSIVGTGAVGAYYGSLLQRDGHDVHFLLRSDFEQVKEHGLIIESCKGDFTLPTVNAYRDAKEMPQCDVVIVALKTTANAALPNILPHLLKNDGVVLTLQNGLGSEEEIAKIVGSKNILGGLCFLCSNKIAPGHIRHLDYGLITIGEYCSDGVPGGITPSVKKIGKALEGAGIPIGMVEDLMLARWKKLAWNIPFNGTAALYNALTDKLISDPIIRKRCKKLMREVAEASALCARPIEEAFICKMIGNTEKMRPYAPSMKLDFERGNPMEIESIYGNPIRTAKKKGIEMPETEKLYQELLAINPSAQNRTEMP